MAEDHSSSVLMRRCTRCKADKPATLEHFPPHKMGKYGLHPNCRPCKKLGDAELRQRTDQKARQKAWRDANKDCVDRYNRAYREAGYTSTAHVAAWRAENIEHARQQEARRHRERRATDPAYRLRGRISVRLYTMLQGKAGRSTETLLGYTMQELRAHIERQFTKGMTWEAVARGEVEIDHILPVSSFSITNHEDPDFRVCWGLANLRPMWAVDNRKKGGKVLTLL